MAHEGSSSRAVRLALVCVLVACSGAVRPKNGTTSGGPISVSVTPASTELAPRAQLGFTATVSGTDNQGVDWTVSEGAPGGSVNAAGVYTASTTPGTYHVVATSKMDDTKSAQATVVVNLGAPASGPPGTWTAVTPGNVQLSGLSCGNFGTNSIGVDPQRPAELYTFFHCQGVWKSTDYGATWTGPVNTGTNGSAIAGAGGLTVARGAAGAPPILYLANIRDPGTGFWRSVDGGVSWTRYTVPASASRQDYYAPDVNPYDPNHLLMPGHEMNYLVESTDGGQTWRNVPMDGGMNQNGGTAFAFFVDTGSADTTRTTWLWMAQAAGGVYGTWRTANAGASWTRVDKNEHPHGNAQIYQPGGGVVYMAGVYSALGWGVLRSADHGQTWTHVGASINEAGVFGTGSRVYAMYGWAVGPGGSADPSLQVADQPGTGAWTMPGTPGGMTQGPAQAAVTFDGTHYVIVTANYNSGLWRYVEP